MKKMLALLLTLCLLAGMVPATALAADDVSYVDENGDTKTCASATDVVAENTTWSSEDGQAAWYVVNSEVTIASRITVNGTVNLILADDCTLTAQKGIYVGSGNSLTIYGQSGNTGKLVANAQYATNYAGIGGNDEEDAPHGNITINGGDIEATGGSYAAGIGSGCNNASYSSTNTTPNQTITINGGKVTATGGTHAAGIGGGYFNKIPGGNIVINGGTVNATGGVKAAGIGSGFSDLLLTANGRSITISGGTVTANGGSDAAGIGGGQGCKETSITSITINGTANVTANGGTKGAGIGSGYDTAMTTSISIGGNAVVKAEGGDDESYGGAGIGSGGGTTSKIGSITISGGNVTATGGTATGSSSPAYSGAGIGSGGHSKTVDLVGSDLVITPGSGAITIDGGTVTATGGGTGAAGIGDGKNGKGGDFSTGEDGQAIIYAGSISDKDNTGDWNGIIFQGDDGKVYGEVTLQKDLTLESGQELTVPADSKLVVPKEKNLVVKAGATLRIEQDGNLTNNGTVSNAGTLTNNGTMAGSGEFTGDNLPNVLVAEFGESKFKTLTAAIKAANSAEGGGTVTLLKDANLSTDIGSGVTLSVNMDITLTIDAANLTTLIDSEGKIQVNAGGVLIVEDTKMIGGSDANINLTKGYIEIGQESTALALSFVDATAEVPSGHRWTLLLANDYPMNVTLDEDTTLTVTSTGVTGGEQDGFRVANKATLTNNGKIVVNGVMTISSEGTDGGNGSIQVSGILVNNQTTANVANTITLASGGKVYSQANIADKLSGSKTPLSDKTYNNIEYAYAWKYYVSGGGTVTPTPPRPTEEKHSITISTDGKGQVTGPASAAEDDKVTLTVKPNADKELYDLKVTDEDGKAIAVTKVNDTTYTFTMPDGKVTVAATFGCDGGDNCPSKAFTDLGDKQWYHDFIDYAVENGLLEGTSATTMEPNATLIRAQLAQILYNIEDKPAVTGEMIFEDVPASEWFYNPILWANQNEIINGTSATTFEPLEDISRQDLALMLYRYAGKPAVTGDLDGFTDGDQVGDWAEEAMAWAVDEGIVQGDTPTTLNPTGTATRAEAAAMLQRFLENAA